MIGYNRAHCPCNLHATVAKPRKCRAIEVLKTAMGASPIVGSNPTAGQRLTGLWLPMIPYACTIHRSERKPPTEPLGKKRRSSSSKNISSRRFPRAITW